MPSPSLVVLGGSGMVGARGVELLNETFEIAAPSHAELDVLDANALRTFLEATPAHAVLNFAAWADVDGAEPERGDTTGVVYRLNAEFPRQLAATCHTLGKHLVHVSTDYVFDGTRADRPYTETDEPHALGWYAETKLRGEQAILESGAEACIARIEMPFSGRAHRKRDLARTVQARLQAGQSIFGVTDQRITPVFLDDAVHALGRLVDARYRGIVHVASRDWTTPYELARWIANRLGLQIDLIQPESFERFAATRPALRPQHSWLDTSRFAQEFGSGILRSVEDELEAWSVQLEPAT